MTEHDKIRERLALAFSSGKINKLFAAIELVADLPWEEALGIVATILGLRGNLGIKLQALRILPKILTPQNATGCCALIANTLLQPDPELIRNALLIAQEIPARQVTTEVLDSVVGLLNSKDTDIQYQAVRTLGHLRSLIPYDDFRSYLRPLTTHPNAAVKGAAQLALRQFDQN